MKKILLIFSIILTFTTYSLAAGSGGGNGSDNSSKKQSNAIKYKYAEKNINKAKKYEKKNKLEKTRQNMLNSFFLCFPLRLPNLAFFDLRCGFLVIDCIHGQHLVNK